MFLDRVYGLIEAGSPTMNGFVGGSHKDITFPDVDTHYSALCYELLWVSEISLLGTIVDGGIRLSDRMGRQWLVTIFWVARRAIAIVL